MTNGKPIDLSKAKASALEALAAHGDAAAARELARRGVETARPLDMSALKYLELRRQVLAFNKGRMPEDRQRSRQLAEAAQFEIECRYRVDLRRWERNHTDENGEKPAPIPPPAPPWLAPRPPRAIGWERPDGSKLYPGETDLVRAAFNKAAREAYARTK